MSPIVRRIKILTLFEGSCTLIGEISHIKSSSNKGKVYTPLSLRLLPQTLVDQSVGPSVLRGDVPFPGPDRVSKNIKVSTTSQSRVIYDLLIYDRIYRLLTDTRV